MVLFEEIEIGGVVAENRIVRSATAESMATEEGFVTDDLIRLYKKLAEGRAGVVITGHMFVSEDGKASLKMAGISSDKFIEGLTKLVEAVKDANEKQVLVAQLSHAGRQGVFNPVAPSPVPDRFLNIEPRELSREEIEKIIEDFANAAVRAKKAGFDAVQLHAAHGYLLSEFLSPYTNRRTDEYGQERAKIVLDIKERIDEKTRIPVIIKMNGSDFVPGGLEIDEAVKIAKQLENAGFAAIEVSGGMYESMLHHGVNMTSQEVPVVGEAYFRDFARKVKEAVNIPVIAVGGIRSVEVAEKLLKERCADMISMSRPLIRDPYLPLKWMRGETDKSDCKSCNACMGMMFQGEKLACYAED